MKSVDALAVTVLSSLSQAVCAQNGDAVDRLKACSQFEGMERLKCVDELLQKVAPDPAQPQGPNWIISEATSFASCAQCRMAARFSLKCTLVKVSRMKVRFNWSAWIPSDVRSRQRATGPSPDRRRLRPSQAHLRSFTCRASAGCLPAQTAKQQRKPRSFTMIVAQPQRNRGIWFPGRTPAPSLCDMASAASTVRLLISSF